MQSAVHLQEGEAAKSMASGRSVEGGVPATAGAQEWFKDPGLRNGGGK